MEEEVQQFESAGSRPERIRTWAEKHARGPYATPALSLLSFAEAVFFPVPVDTLLIPLVILKARSFLYYTCVASIASVLGGVAGYAIGYFLFSTFGSPLIAFYGLEMHLDAVSKWLMFNAFLATFVSAFTPIPYKVFAIAAGVLHAPFFIFVIASVLGRTLRYLLVAYIAHVWGERIVRAFLRHFTLATLVLVGSFLLFYLLNFFFLS